MRRKNSSIMFPFMLAQTAAASAEVIMRRTMMMATNSCSPAEYQRMLLEKATALGLSSLAIATGKGPVAALEPWRRKAVANATRLRSSKKTS